MRHSRYYVEREPVEKTGNTYYKGFAFTVYDRKQRKAVYWEPEQLWGAEQAKALANDQAKERNDRWDSITRERWRRRGETRKVAEFLNDSFSQGSLASAICQAMDAVDVRLAIKPTDVIEHIESAMVAALDKRAAKVFAQDHREAHRLSELAQSIVNRRSNAERESVH